MSKNFCGRLMVKKWDNKCQFVDEKKLILDSIEGKSLADMLIADKIWNDHLDTVGMPGGLYRWFPNEGWPRADKTDFMQVFVTDTLANQGKTSDMMIAGSGRVLGNTYGEIFHCDNPRVWQFQFSSSSQN